MKKKFLDLGTQPIANRFLTEKDFDTEYFYNLSVGFDSDTKLITHIEYVDPPLMFNDEYVYRGSMSKTMREHFGNFSQYLREYLDRPIRILEIGSNDGVFIKNWQTEQSLAVEPCGNFAKETNELGYKTYPNFWDTKLANQIKDENGQVDVIFAANCICHIPDLDETFQAVDSLLAPGGYFIFEDPSLAQMINNNSYDQIYDEHPHIFSVIALKNLLERNNLTVVRVDNTDVHGGSNRIWAQRISDVTEVDDSVQFNLDFEKLLGLDQYETFVKFAEKVEQSKKDLVALLTRAKEQGRKVISYGATSKSTTIFNYCGIGPDLIQLITDTTPEKQNKLAPGSHIPVVSPEQGLTEDVTLAYLGAWNFSKEIMEKESEYIKRGGKFFTHVPLVKFI